MQLLLVLLILLHVVPLLLLLFTLWCRVLLLLLWQCSGYGVNVLQSCVGTTTISAGCRRFVLCLLPGEEGVKAACVLNRVDCARARNDRSSGQQRGVWLLQLSYFHTAAAAVVVFACVFPSMHVLAHVCGLLSQKTEPHMPFLLLLLLLLFTLWCRVLLLLLPVPWAAAHVLVGRHHNRRRQLHRNTRRRPALRIR